MRLQLLFPILLLSLLAGCSDGPEIREREIYEVKNIGMLSTSEYTVGKIVKLSDDKEWYKWGDRKILMSCKARIKAGVDLSAISEKDIKASGKRIELTIPAPQIVSFEMDPDLIRTELVDINGFREDFNQEEKNTIMQLGEAAIRRDLKELNILNDAGKNAKAFLTDFYKELGFEEVIIHDTDKSKRD